MKKGTRGEARVHTTVQPEKLYDLVSDVTRMGEWSPETVRCRWIGGATGPAVGARFKGSNRHGIARWSTKPRVVATEPGREFSFVSNFLSRDMTRWTYKFEPADGGTDITESFEMVRDMPWYIAAFDRYVMGVKDRKADLEQAMSQTLGRIKAAAEGSA